MLVELGVVEQRYKAVLEVLGGATEHNWHLGGLPLCPVTTLSTRAGRP